jgi:uncharacterized protein (DUF305 family)
MVLFSRSFVRRRMISLATTASIAATSFAFADDPAKTDHLRGAMPIQRVANQIDHSTERLFLSDNDASMLKMSADAMIKPIGGVDHDFVAMMMPHHQGAVDMPNAELNYGHGVQPRWQAQEIAATEKQVPATRNAVVAGQSVARRSIAPDGMKMSR